MSLATNTGDAFLDSYARQINRLEKDPNATAEYDKALEQQFAAIKAQVLGSGDGGHAPGSGAGDPATTPPATTHGSSGGSSASGSGGSSAAPPATTPGTGSGGGPSATGSGNGGSSATPPGTTSGGSGGAGFGRQPERR